MFQDSSDNIISSSQIIVVCNVFLFISELNFSY